MARKSKTVVHALRIADVTEWDALVELANTGGFSAWEWARVLTPAEAVEMANGLKVALLTIPRGAVRHPQTPAERFGGRHKFLRSVIKFLEGGRRIEIIGDFEKNFDAMVAADVAARPEVWAEAGDALRRSIAARDGGTGDEAE